ncbi:antibiotic biosynthesis monooxygenase family protein [Inhella proteolytica]|uniref:Antibiotic biosynthesis monooxygenase n=1 Tax=Inhella proteolytica TaxID=2795029 RepID=A0A931J4J4_9BURK|nr:antibiotic biosynthesis monooxygenase [Inhella proteolytica]MBH9578603.1 antibiotic biosynthesis monooxygenase [Inhella proteolytica]
MSPAYVYVWEFRVARAQRVGFLAAYGQQGRWAQLFAQAPGYLGTQLLQDQADENRFLTLDRWASAAAHADFHAQFDAEYRALDQECEILTEDERSLGSYWGL